MKVNIFAVADSVNAYEQGKLVIVGTFDNIQTEKCPFVFKPFGVALKLSAERNDYNKSYETRLVLRKMGTRKAIVEIPLPLKFTKPPKGKRIAAVLAANIVGAKFDSFGAYILELRVASKVISEIYINVIKTKSVKKKETIKTKPEKKRKK